MKSGASSLLVGFALLAVLNCSSSTPSQSSASAGQSSAGTAQSSAGAAQSAAGQGAGGDASQASGTSAAVPGPSDAHCVGRPLGISDPAICTSTAGASSFAGANAMTASSGASSGGSADNGGSGGASAGTGGVDCNLTHDAGYGDTLFDSEGDDDDCKYHVAWTSTPVEKGKPFTLTVTATSKTTGEPLEHIAAQDPGKPALSRIEPFLPCEPSHLAPTSDYEARVTEIGPGTFTVGPVVFDESGHWAVRYHFYEECFNNVTTPHAHIAFFVNVP